PISQREGGACELCHGKIQLRACRFVDPAVLHIVNDADDREPWSFHSRAARRTHAVSDCAFTRPINLCHRLINNDDEGRSWPIAVIERSSFEKSNAQNSKVMWSDELPVIDVLNRTTRSRNKSLDFRIVGIDRTKWWKAAYCRDVVDSGQATNPTFESCPELRR